MRCRSRTSRSPRTRRPNGRNVAPIAPRTSSACSRSLWVPRCSSSCSGPMPGSEYPRCARSPGRTCGSPKANWWCATVRAASAIRWCCPRGWQPYWPPPPRSGATVLPWGTYQTRERFRLLCLRSGVGYQGRGVHGLRHAAGSRLYEAVGDLGQVADHLRHADVNTTRGYAKRNTERIRTALEDW